MKKILISLLAGLVITGVCLAGKYDSQTLTLTSSYNLNAGTNTSVATTAISGKIMAIEITVSGTFATNTVTISTSSQNLLNGATVLSNVVYYPRLPVQALTGTNLSAAINWYEPVVVVQDRITLKAVAGAANTQTNTVTARIMLEN
jgi:hypothetical protein